MKWPVMEGDTQAHGLAGYEFAAVQFPAGGGLSLFPAAVRPGCGAAQEIPPQYSHLQPISCLVQKLLDTK